MCEWAFCCLCWLADCWTSALWGQPPLTPPSFTSKAFLENAGRLSRGGSTCHGDDAFILEMLSAL